MCEPYHSIIQYPPEDDGGNPLGPKVEKIAGKQSLLKRILGWLHLSKIGRGHSEAIQECRMTDRMLPAPTYYEGAWWERTCTCDGTFAGMRRPSYFVHGGSSREYLDKHREMQRQSAEAAEEYSRRVCWGSLSAFRNFLENSLMNTDRPRGYIRNFMEGVLTPEGRDKMTKKFRKVFGIKLSPMLWSPFRADAVFELFRGERKKQAVSCLMGFTRKRELFLPHWADDNSIWTP